MKIGASAAAAHEAAQPVSDLLERVKGVTLASGGEWEPRKAFHVHGPARLPIRFERGRRAGAQG